jgi:hypothetical protein
LTPHPGRSPRLWPENGRRCGVPGIRALDLGPPASKCEVLILLTKHIGPNVKPIGLARPMVSSLKLMGNAGDLVISGASGTVATMFKLTRMGKIFHFYENNDAAVTTLL